MKSSEIVVARYNENVEWTRDYNNVVVYNKGESLDDLSCLTCPNVGREAHTYLYHIVNRWTDLAELTVFFQGTEPSFGYQGRNGGGHLCSSVRIEDYLERETFIYTSSITTDEKFHRSRSSYLTSVNLPRPVSGLPDGSAQDHWTPFLWYDWANEHFNKLKDSQRAPLRDFEFCKFTTNLLGIEISRLHHINYAQGAQFSVLERTIKKRPLHFYESLLSAVDSHVCPYEAVFMEWSWGLIFDDFERVIA